MFTLELRKSGQAGFVRGALLLVPVAYHIASVQILLPHGVAFPVYLIVVTVAAVLVALRFDLAVLRVIAWIAVALPLSYWIEAHRSQSWIVGSVTTVMAVTLVHLAAQIRVARDGKDPA